MAAGKIHHRYLVGGDRPTSMALHDAFEFDESDVWCGNDGAVAAGNKSEPPNYNKKSKLHNNYSPHRPIWKPARKAVDHQPPVGPKSLPVKIPDWSKILGDEYRRHGDGEVFTDDDDEEEEDGIEKMPPHEYLARTRTASFSVHEGVGRTLKGRDLSRVRNAIWKQIGLIDED